MPSWTEVALNPLFLLYFSASPQIPKLAILQALPVPRLQWGRFRFSIG
jgi:hypothetical protein